MAGYRLPDGGSHIERVRPLTFTFDGRELTGYTGDTLASALLANGISVVARSFKYHRGRGIYSAGHEEPNALVTLESAGVQEPNVKATVVDLHQGLKANGQNAWPSLRFDVMAINQLASSIFVAGFYYKTFMGMGQRFWHFFERFIRRAAGLGKLDSLPDPARYEHANIFAKTLIVGGGAAGLAAARAAAQNGDDVVLVDEGQRIGGALFEDQGSIDGLDPADWAQNTLAALPNLRILERTSVYGYFDDDVLGAVERVAEHEPAPDIGQPRLRHLKIHADHVIIATGATERPLIFVGNDLPGVMLAQSALRYAARHGVAVGRDVILTGNNDSIYNVALCLRKHGVNVTAVVDMRSADNSSRAAELRSLGIAFYPGQAVTRAYGKSALHAVDVAKFDAQDRKTAGATTRLKCDALLVSGGFTPMVNLCSQAGTPPVYDAGLDGFIPGEALQDWVAVGAVSGALDLTSAVAEGHKAGLAASGGSTSCAPPKVSDASPKWLPGAPAHAIFSSKSFVDLQHDVTSSDIALAHREGFQSVEHLKRYTTLGMATDQGKTSNVNAIAIMAELKGIAPDAVGTTRFRPPYVPVPLGALAGRQIGTSFKPVRRTPMHDWHLAHGAEMIEAGNWLRPRIYRKRPDESLRDAYVREAAAVRSSVGIVDVTTLGKIDVQGPDAALFLNRIYANPFLKLPIGKARYGVMLREDGILFDDGTTWRLAENQFLTTTTTARAASVLMEMERLLATVWPELRVQVTSVSDQWAGMAVAGPNARKTLQRVVNGLDLSDEAFAPMAIGNASIGGHPVMIARLSFSGELAYEVYCGSQAGGDVWSTLMQAGEEFSITPYGTEALGTLRIEKGHISGPELDGRTTLDDVGLGRMASRKKSYVGSVLIDRDGLLSRDRLQLVGLQSLNEQALRAGAHIVDPESPGHSLGHITSTTYSPALGKFIALALVSGGRDRIGSLMTASFPLKNSSCPVQLVDPVFFDAEGERMHG